MSNPLESPNEKPNPKERCVQKVRIFLHTLLSMLRRAIINEGMLTPRGALVTVP